MNLQRLVENAIATMVIGAVKAAPAFLRLIVTLGRRMAAIWRPLASPKGGSPGNSDDGSEGAGATAPLRPRPPVLSAAAASALPEPDEDAAA